MTGGKVLWLSTIVDESCRTGDNSLSRIRGRGGLITSGDTGSGLWVFGGGFLYGKIIFRGF